MERTFAKVRTRMEELKDLSGIIGLLTWDQETYLPTRAQAARGQQLSTIQGLYHERLVDPAFGEWIAGAAQDPTLSADERAMVRVLKQERDRAVKVPPALVRALAEGQARGVAAWREARQAKDFSKFKPALANLLKLRREQADALGHGGERYDALLEYYEPGMTVARLRPVLERLRDQLIPMVAALTGPSASQPVDVLAGKDFAPDKQWEFTLILLRDMGFDLDAGRQDRSIHPFTGGTHPYDVRLTTRVDPRNLPGTVFSTIHEGGHGLFEQGFHPDHHRTALAQTPSMGVHESQSRLWENVIGRSRAFWDHYFPILQRHFPEHLGSVTVEQFHRSINRVCRTVNRVESDEVTYNLHIALRFELELLLIHDDLPLDELPRAWSDRTEQFLGVRPKDDHEGVLQDIHWAWGELGYFPTYSLGNLYAAQLYETMAGQVPGLEDAIRAGRLTVARDWLRQHVHEQGFRQPAEDLVTRLTGQGLGDGAFLRYLRAKYADLYGTALAA